MNKVVIRNWLCLFLCGFILFVPMVYVHEFVHFKQCVSAGGIVIDYNFLNTNDFNLSGFVSCNVSVFSEFEAYLVSALFLSFVLVFVIFLINTLHV